LHYHAFIRNAQWFTLAKQGQLLARKLDFLIKLLELSKT